MPDGSGNGRGEAPAELGSWLVVAPVKGMRTLLVLFPHGVLPRTVANGDEDTSLGVAVRRP